MLCKLCNSNPQSKYGICYGCLPKPSPKAEVIEQLKPLIGQYQQSISEVKRIVEDFMTTDQAIKEKYGN